MRKAVANLFGLIAVLSVAALPATAAEREQPGEKSACSSYQQNADGTWTAIPCREVQSGEPSRPKSAPHDANAKMR